MRFIRTILFLLLLSGLLLLPVQAATLPRLVDQAGILTSEEASNLLLSLDEISRQQSCDVVIVTVPSLEGKDVTAYADDFYDTNAYGAGSDRTGILLLLAMEEREWAISTTGGAISVFTDASLRQMENAFLPDLRSGSYAAAFSSFVSSCGSRLAQTENGIPAGGSQGFSLLSPLSTLAVVAAGILTAALIVTQMKRQLRSVAPQRAASSYIRPGTPQLLEQRDQFLYRTLSRTPRPKSSGGSSTHRSSSGTRHGGSRGRF